ncbi:hypothetical protein JTB14_025395 [Gonioctena quinquepunctata]|nr:hypothetical protein JTB14_025395 [Gonioctena quinquepunctata]
MILANRPLQGLFSQSSSQSQSQSGIFSDVVSGFSSLLPTPQQFGQGLGDGISSFVQTLPQIGQSFQSLLPNFDDFHLPSFPSFPQGGQSGVPSNPVTSRPIITTTPASVFPNPEVGTDPVDPDDIIYSDEIKPVHEDHDLVTDPYTNNRLRPGYQDKLYFNQINHNALKRIKYQDYGKRRAFQYGSRIVQDEVEPRLFRNQQITYEPRKQFINPQPYFYENQRQLQDFNGETKRQGKPFVFPS